MYLILLTLFLLVNGDKICDKCMCRYDNKYNGDFQGEMVDCSYSDVLDLNLTLPNTIYSLDLSTSNLSKIYQATVLRSDTLAELFLNNNEIVDISNDAFNLPQLKTLDLSNNLLESIDRQVFKNLKSLQFLNLANNMFTTFGKLTFHSLSNLREIVLDNNDIGRSMHEANLFDRSGFGLTQKIKELSLNGVRLNTIPDNFLIDAYDIRQLSMSNNNLTDVFELPFTLDYLDLSDNPIQEIEGEDFNDVPALRVLKLNNLAIKEVHEFAFASLHSLVSLQLERNKNLTMFSKLAFGREVLDDPDDFILESLSLSGSRLTKLDKELMEPFGQLIHLDLQGNPWKCDCNILWVKELRIPEKDYEHFRCATPKPLFNARIFDLDNKYFTCPPNKNHVGIAIAIIAACTGLGSIAIWLFFYIPRVTSRKEGLRQMYPLTAYTVLPISTTITNIND